MNKIVLMLLLCQFFSCGSSDQTHEVPLTTFIDVPAGLNTLETHFFIRRNIPSFYAENLSSFGLNDTQILQITGARAKIYNKVNSYDLNFISRISIYAVSPLDQNKKMEMYYLDLVNFNEGDEIVLLPATSNVKDILDNGKFDLEIRLNFRDYPPTNMRLDIDFSYLLYFQ